MKTVTLYPTPEITQKWKTSYLLCSILMDENNESVDNDEEIIKEESKISEEDVLLVSQQADVSEEVARNALEESDGDLAQAILKLK